MEAPAPKAEVMDAACEALEQTCNRSPRYYMSLLLTTVESAELKIIGDARAATRFRLGTEVLSANSIGRLRSS